MLLHSTFKHITFKYIENRIKFTAILSLGIVIYYIKFTNDFRPIVVVIELESKVITSSYISQMFGLNFIKPLISAW